MKKRKNRRHDVRAINDVRDPETKMLDSRHRGSWWFARSRHFGKRQSSTARASSQCVSERYKVNSPTTSKEPRVYRNSDKTKMPGYTTSYRYTVERHPKEEEAAIYWPYRTTPLVLPGAKVKKDAPLGECYLRHHPNPMIRASPHHYEVANPEVAMKQKVAESVLQRVLGPSDVPKVVHKQFNSPIGLYSEQNIADTIKCQTSAVPKGPMRYDPSKSEAYKALQEEAMGDTMQEVKQPARGAVFSPQKANQNRIYHPPQKSPASSYGGMYRPFPLPFVKDRVNGY